MADAAQEFLDKQLSKNKYTIRQQETLAANGGPAVVNASDGVVPGGDAYAKYGKMPESESSDSPSTTTAAPATSFAKGKMSAEDVRNKFGFSYNEEHAKNSGGYSKYGGRDDGAIYNQKTGEYVGTIDNFTKRGEDDAQGISQFESIQDHELEHGFRSSKRTDWDSMNDVAGAVQNLLGEKQDAASTEPEKERTPIEHSPEVKQATERVRAYEDNVMSGKTSDDIFQGSSNAKYSLDLDKGEDGIGTSYGSEPKSQEATKSFLDSKKTDYKKAYNFQPKTSSVYGAN